MAQVCRAGHPGVFEVWPTAPEGLAAFVERVRGLPIHGLAVTIPHKTAIAPFLDGLTEEAQAVGAVNTLLWRDGSLLGHNTDVTGFLAGLRSFRATRGSPQVVLSSSSQDAPQSAAPSIPQSAPQSAPHSALVLGAGGAAHAVIHGLQSLGVKDIRLAARNEQSGAALTARFNVEFIPWEKRVSRPAQLVVNTTPLGMAGGAGAGETPLSAADFAALAGDFSPAVCLAYDLVYNPLATPFLLTAGAAGWGTQEGLTMLAAQGLAQFKLWSGLEPPPLAEAVTVLKAALELSK